MSLLLWGLTIGTIGKVVLGVAVLRVHMGIVKEHKIDGFVLNAMKRERLVTLFALLLIVIGYALEVLFYSGSTDFLTCEGTDCVAAITASFSQ